MNKIPQQNSAPTHLDWHLIFCGHVDEVNRAAFEESFMIKMGILNPVSIEKEESDDDEVVIDIFLEWNKELNRDLLTMNKYGFTLYLNERL